MIRIWLAALLLSIPALSQGLGLKDYIGRMPTALGFGAWIMHPSRWWPKFSVFCAFYYRRHPMLTTPNRLASVALALASVLVPAALAQAPQWEADPFSEKPQDLLRAAAKAEAPDEADVVVLLEEARYRFDEQGAADVKLLRIYHVRTQQGADEWNSIGSSWQPWRQEKPVFRARVITADGGVHELDPGTVAEAAQETGATGIYSDRRLLRGPLPAVAPGSVVVTEIAIQDHRPAFDAGVSRRLYFATQAPVRKARVQIEAPKSAPVRYVLRKADGADVQRTEDGDRVTLTFEAGPFWKADGPEPNLPPDEPWWPHVTFDTGASWNAVGRRYREILDRQIADDSVEAILEGLSARGSRRTVIEALTRALHDRVRYTGVEFGEASYVPRSPSETLERRYGDCKDKATLLIAMLRTSGIDATIALLRTGPGADIEPETPGLGLFDHAIVYLPHQQEPLWIDATDPYSRVGDLPLRDQGRLALIADEQTKALVRIPSSSSADNRAVETREFFLAPFGGARVVETTRSWGFIARNYREFYDGVQGDELKEPFGIYVGQTYGSENIVDIALNGTFDFSEPHQIRLVVDDALIGATDVAEAAVVIPQVVLLENLPFAIVIPAGDEEEERREDFEFRQPYTTEWRYRIVPPLGYQPRELPEARDQRLGSARFSAEYSKQENQTVLATLRFDSGKRRLTAEEFRGTREAIQEFGETEPIIIAFDQVGEAHLTAGRIREAIAEFRSLRDAEPDSAIHYTRIARAMLEAGLGEPARHAARRAVELEPESSLTHRILGWILEASRAGPGCQTQDQHKNRDLSLEDAYKQQH